jgi:hypothetical protein
MTVSIEQVTNGYILTESGLDGDTYVYSTLEEAVNAIAQRMDGNFIMKKEFVVVDQEEREAV